MGWSIGFDQAWSRDVGYGVPAYCDHPECNKEIHRGLSFVCGGEPYGGEHGCGLYFCSAHLQMGVEGPEDENGEETEPVHTKQVCERCAAGQDNFPPKEDHPSWVLHKLRDRSWYDWRKENGKEVAAMRARMKALKAKSTSK